jgi:hypothetical protein
MCVFMCVCVYVCMWSFEAGFHYVSQAGLELSILLPQCSDPGIHHHTWLTSHIFNYSLSKDTIPKVSLHIIPENSKRCQKYFSKFCQSLYCIS